MKSYRVNQSKRLRRKRALQALPKIDRWFFRAAERCLRNSHYSGYRIYTWLTDNKWSK